MLYITDERESLKSLMQKEGHTGSFGEYAKELSIRNPHLCLKNLGEEQVFPSFCPVILVTEPSGLDSLMVVRAIQEFPLKQRKQLREFQEQGADILLQVVMEDIMEGLQTYSASFRKFYDDPLIKTPWDAVNHALPNSSIPDLLAELSIYSAQKVSHSRRLIALDLLYENILKRDDINRRLQMLSTQRGVQASSARLGLERQAKELTGEIKRLLNARIDEKLRSYLSSFSSDEIRKLRTNSFSQKAVRRGSTVATRLDFFNRSGIKGLQKMISRLRTVENGARLTSKYLGVAAVAYDVSSAYYRGTSKSRAFLTGAAGIGTSAALSYAGSSSALGALAIAGLTGEGAAVTCLMFTPAGVFVATVAGIAVVGYAGYKASEFVGEVWDTYGDQVYHKVASVGNEIYEDVKSGWRTLSHWVIGLYGD